MTTDDKFFQELEKKLKQAQDKQQKLITKEAFLEFVERDDGTLVLKEMGSDDALVSINFADSVREMIGTENLRHIGEHMIQAGIASFMHRQVGQYHAHVYDEKPKHFS